MGAIKTFDWHSGAVFGTIYLRHGAAFNEEP